MGCGGATPNTIAFMSYNQDAGSVNIYLADLNGENLVNLTGDLPLSASDFAAWSPRGDKIAYFTPTLLELGNDTYILHIADDKGNEIASVDDIPSKRVTTPAWSPDASKIAFVSSTQSDTFSVYMTDSKGNNLLLLDTIQGKPQTASGQPWFTPIWSPDSSKVCVISGAGRDYYPIFSPYAIYVIDTQGNRLISLKDDSTEYTPMGYFDSGIYYLNPEWSPDGSKLMFTVHEGTSSDVYVINADGTGSINLTQGNYDYSSGAWLPNSDKVIFTSEIDGNYATYIINSDGTGLTRLTPDVDNFRFAWPSPDGSKILVRLLNDNNREYYVMDADGSEPIRLHEPMESIRDYTWAPDSSKIVFTSFNKEETEASWETPGTFPGTVYDIHVVNADGTGLIKVASENTQGTHPLWAPDSERIIFRRGHYSDSDICVVNADGSGLINLTDDLETHNWSPVVPSVGH